MKFALAIQFVSGTLMLQLNAVEKKKHRKDSKIQEIREAPEATHRAVIWWKRHEKGSVASNKIQTWPKPHIFHQNKFGKGMTSTKVPTWR